MLSQNWGNKFYSSEKGAYGASNKHMRSTVLYERESFKQAYTGNGYNMSLNHKHKAECQNKTNVIL